MVNKKYIIVVLLVFSLICFIYWVFPRIEGYYDYANVSEIAKELNETLA